MTQLLIHNTNLNNLCKIMRLKAYYEIHNSFDHSLNATYAKCIGVQVSQLMESVGFSMYNSLLTYVVSFFALFSDVRSIIFYPKVLYASCIEVIDSYMLVVS